jgi:hypothetical protein
VSIFILLALAVGVLVVGIKKGALNPVEMLSSLTSLFSRSGGSDGGPAYGRIGEMEPETALNYPTYGDDEDFGLDTEDDRQVGGWSPQAIMQMSACAPSHMSLLIAFFVGGHLTG